MKPKKIKTKLNLNKKTVANLASGDMKVVKGGATELCSVPPSDCKTNCDLICRTQEISVCYCETDDPAICLYSDHWLLCPDTLYVTECPA